MQSCHIRRAVYTTKVRLVDHGCSFVLQCRLKHLGDFFFREHGADEKLLTRARAKSNGFPAIRYRYGDADGRLASRVAHLPDDAGNDQTNFRVIAQQALQHGAQAIDDAVLDFKFVLFGAQSHGYLKRLLYWKSM